jgi:hypothetical protein
MTTWQHALDLASDRLSAMAGERFVEYGPGDPRGAAIWDAAQWINEQLRPELQERDGKASVPDNGVCT